MLRLGVGLLGAWRVVRGAQPFEVHGYMKLKAAVGVQRPVLLLCSDRLTVPAMVGLARPAIVFPASAREWSEERVGMAIAHELAHIRQGDWIWSILAQVACAMYPFNPLAWMFAYRLRAESEHAADDRVVRTGIAPAAYASELIAVARTARSNLATTVAMARNARVEKRVRAIVNARRRRAATAPLSVLLLAAAAAVSCAGISAFRFGGMSTSQQPNGGGIALANPAATPGWRGPITVRVLDPDGNPCPGAKLVFLMTSSLGYGSGKTVPAALTDSMGRFYLHPSLRVKSLPQEPDIFFDTASVAGVLAYKPGIGISGSAGLDRDHPDTEVRLCRSGTARVSIVDGLGHPVAGAVLTADRICDRPHEGFTVPVEWRVGAYRAVSGPDGIATFEDVPQGWSVNYRLGDDRFLPVIREQENPPVSGSTLYPAIHLVTAATISGYARCGSRPLPGLSIQATFDGKLPRSAVTDASGHYTITRAPDGPCAVHYFVPPYVSVPLGMAARPLSPGAGHRPRKSDARGRRPRRRRHDRRLSG